MILKMKHYSIVNVAAVISLLLLLFISCNKGAVFKGEADYSDVETIRYDYTKDNFIPRDSVFGDISFVKLETRDDNHIGMVNQVLLGDSTIIVVDWTIANGVFMFDFDGKYLGKISGLGDVHNEYRRLSYVCKKSDNTIALFDEWSNKIMMYDERGHYIKSIYTNLLSASAMEFISDDLMAYDIYFKFPTYNEKYGNMSFLINNLNMETKYKFGRTDFKPFSYTRCYNLYSYDNHVYCNVNFKDCIYELKEDGVKAKYRLLYGPENVTEHSFKTKNEYNELQELYPYFDGDFVELKDYTYVMFSGENGRELLYKHSTKETFALSSEFDNPMVTFFRHPNVRYKDNIMVCALSAAEVCYCLMAIIPQTPENNSVKALFPGINIDTNPILFFYELVS
jgi:hypothetical protein